MPIFEVRVRSLGNAAATSVNLNFFEVSQFWNFLSFSGEINKNLFRRDANFSSSLSVWFLLIAKNESFSEKSFALDRNLVKRIVSCTGAERSPEILRKKFSPSKWTRWKCPLDTVQVSNSTVIERNHFRSSPAVSFLVPDLIKIQLQSTKLNLVARIFLGCFKLEKEFERETLSGDLLCGLIKSSLRSSRLGLFSMENLLWNKSARLHASEIHRVQSFLRFYNLFVIMKNLY